tara:strand:- start:2649 stop:3044 length:396 start_codon:yes stop_codon:yes gene_type:complete
MFIKLKIFKIFIFLFFIFFANSYADYNWKKITESNNRIYYVDHSSIKSSGNKVYFLTLTDYYKPDEFGDLSNIIYREADCSKMSYRFLKDFYYSQPMGNGEPSEIIDEVGEWRALVPGSVGEYMTEYVCNY